MSPINFARSMVRAANAAYSGAVGAFNAAGDALSASNRFLANARNVAINATRAAGNATANWSHKAARATASVAAKGSKTAWKATAARASTAANNIANGAANAAANAGNFFKDAGNAMANWTEKSANATANWTEKAANVTAKFTEKNGAIALKGIADRAVTVGEGTVKLAKDGYNTVADSPVGKWVEKAANDVAKFSEGVANDTAELAKDIGDFTEKHANDFRDFSAEQVEMSLQMAGINMGEKKGEGGDQYTGGLDEAACGELTSFDWVGGVCIEKEYKNRIIDQSVCGTLSAFEWTNDECILKDVKVDYSTQCMTNGGDISMEMLLPIEAVVGSTVETYVTPPRIGQSVKLSVEDQKNIKDQKKRIAIMRLYEETSDVRKRIKDGKKNLKSAEREYGDKVREQQVVERQQTAARLHLELKERELAAEKVKQYDAQKLVDKKIEEERVALVERDAAKRAKDAADKEKNAAIAVRNAAAVDRDAKVADSQRKNASKIAAQNTLNQADTAERNAINAMNAANNERDAAKRESDRLAGVRNNAVNVNNAAQRDKNNKQNDYNNKNNNKNNQAANVNNKNAELRRVEEAIRAAQRAAAAAAKRAADAAKKAANAAKKFFCLSGNTPIKLLNGKVVLLKDIKLEDVLVNGATVDATMQIKSSEDDPFYKIYSEELEEYVFVTGSHSIKSGDKYISVCDFDKAEKLDRVDNIVYCLVTSDHTIPVGEFTFWDWEDQLLIKV